MTGRGPIRLIYQSPASRIGYEARLTGVSSYVRLHSDLHLRLINERLGSAVEKFKSMGIHGAFVAPESTKEELQVFQSGIPCILTHTSSIQKVLPYCTANNILAGKMAAEHFIRRGFQHFAYVSVGGHLFWSQERIDGFEGRIAAARAKVFVYEPRAANRGKKRNSMNLGHPYAPSLWTGYGQDILGWLQSLPKPVGVMACNDEMGYELTEACGEARIKVPEEVAIIGMYNQESLCLAADPPLSSIELDVERNGYEAAALLHKIILGEAKMEGQRTLNEPVRIVTRQSSDIVAVNDNDVAAALHYIRTHFDRPIRVDDVVNQTMTSRRSLEMKFRKFIRHSVADEIMRIKVDKISHLLLESDMSIQQISECLKFSTPARMREAFYRAKGINPLMFRQKHGKI